MKKFQEESIKIKRVDRLHSKGSEVCREDIEMGNGQEGVIEVYG